MPSRPVGVADAAPAVTGVDVDTVERASPDLTTTITTDPGAAGTTLVVTANAKFPGTNNYKIDVGGERMLVTGGAGTNSWTVTRGIDGTASVAHAIGTVVSYVVAVQRVEPVQASKQVTYLGRGSTFKTLGRAGTAGQKIFAIFNAAGSTVLVDVDKITIDVMQIAAKVVEPPAVRAWKIAAVPTNGNAVTKVPEDSLLASNSSVTLWQDSSADNTSSATALAATLPAGTIITEEWAARALTLTGYEQFDKSIFFDGQDEVITLRAGEGICIFLDYTVATANPATDKWTTTVRWIEYTAA
jgi:hypothetical protein